MCLLMVLISGFLRIKAYYVHGEKDFSDLGLRYEVHTMSFQTFSYGHLILS